VNAQPDYFANHERARQFPWTLYHAPLERDLERFLAHVAERDPRIVDGHVVAPEQPIDVGKRFAAIYAKEVVEHVLAWPTWLVGLRRALLPRGTLWLSTPNYGEPWLPALESTVLELVARRSGFTRRHIHPTRFSRRSLERGLAAAGFAEIAAHVTTTRLAITAWCTAP